MEKLLQPISNQEEKITVSVILLLCVGILSPFFPSSLIGIVALALSLIAVGSNRGYQVFPIMMFYYNNFGEVAGIRTFYIYATIYIICLIVQKQVKVKKNYLGFLVFGIYITYLFIVMFPVKAKAAILYPITIICIVLLVNNSLIKSESLKCFFKIFVICAIFSYITGLIENNNYNTVLIINGVSTDISRVMGTFNDPNYMGLYYSVAVFAMLSLQLFTSKVRVFFTVVLSIMMATTLSITAIVGNFVFWMIYLWATKKRGVKVFAIIALTVIGLFFIYKYLLVHPDFPYFGNLAARISNKILNVRLGDVAAVTTGRSNHAKDHLDYFMNQGLARMLFGGNRANSMAIDLNIGTIAAHNEYVDLLLNVGVFGTVILVLYPVQKMIQSFLNYRENKRPDDLCFFMVKVIYLVYAATLTLFLESRFLIFYFL